MTRIHNIGHIHNANFAQTQFSTSHPQKQHFLKSWKFTFLWKYSVCGFKFEISEYPIKRLYAAYKYELKRMKTHEIRAKYFFVIFLASLYFWRYSVENWVWAKLALWICSILWIRIPIGYKQLSLNIFSLSSAGPDAWTLWS